MVKIRLTRAGAKKRPYYRIVAIDAAASGTAGPSSSWAPTIPRASPSGS
jgi:hypothetical protein